MYICILIKSNFPDADTYYCLILLNSGDPDETQEQQEGILEQMKVEGQDTTEILIKRGMGISAAPEKYQPAPPRYVRAEESSEDEEDGQDEEEDLEAPYLAPKSALSSGPAQSEE